MQTETAIVGIDFGTTNSVCCQYIDKTLTYISFDGEYMLPSIIAIGKDNSIIIGKKAALKIGNPDYFIVQSIKSLISHSVFNANKDQPDGITIFEKYYSYVSLAALILGHIKNRAQEYLGKTLESCVITVPAYFDDVARTLVKHAATLADLEVLRIINEPTAAALSYGIDNQKEGCYAIYDFGGGTFDISILRFKNKIFQVLSTSGDIDLGGDNLDSAITTYLKDTYSFLSGSNADLLKMLAREIKHSLSNKNHYNRKINGHIIALGKEKIEELILPLLNKTIEILKLAVKDSGVGAKDIKGVVLVGGSTRIPLVKTLISKTLNAEILSDLNPDTIVAAGAAIKAHDLINQQDAGILVDVTPLSLGIEMMGGIVEKIIQRNTPLPFSANYQFTTFKNNQTGIEFHIVQGERPLAKDCLSLATFTLKNLPPLPAGHIKANVRLNIDVNGILTVTATEEKSGGRCEITIDSKINLDEKEIKKLLKDAIINYDNDAQMSVFEKIKISAEELIANAQEIISTPTENPAILQYHEKIAKYIKMIKSNIETKNITELKKNYQVFDQMVSEISLEIMNDALSDLIGKSIDNVNKNIK